MTIIQTILRMESEFYQLCGKLVDERYVRQGEEGRRKRNSAINNLLRHKKLPKEAWDEDQIQLLLRELALMDTNNFADKCGAGEREGRVFSRLVSQRHFGFSHGIGRSGDVTAIQPKAAGSSVLVQLANKLALDALRSSGVVHAASCFVVPVATGMSIVLTLSALRTLRPSANHVIWSRIDQKSCFKAIGAAGLQPVVVQLKREGDQLTTDLAGIEAAIDRVGGPEEVLCVLTTTSCFAPRAPDDLVGVARICKSKEIPHVVNNAYGVQSSKCTHLIEEANRVGRLDVFVQSTDKNFMVPVGGAIIAGFDTNLIAKIAKTYPGRASASPLIDLVITLLSMGKDTYSRLLKERKENYAYLKSCLEKCAIRHGETLLDVPGNPISMAVSLSSASFLKTDRGSSSDIRPSENGVSSDPNDLMLDQLNFNANAPTSNPPIAPSSRVSRLETEIGSMLFTRCVSGARAVSSQTSASINGVEFTGWGAHCDEYPTSYLTAGVGIGMTREEIDTFIQRLDKVFKK